MTLTTTCKTCRHLMRFRERADDRVQLVTRRGENIDLKCEKCGQSKQYHVDDISAEADRFMTILNSIILLIGTPLIIFIIWKTIGGLTYIYAIAGLLGTALVPLFVYMTIAKSQRERQHTFNRHKIRGPLRTIRFDE